MINLSLSALQLFILMAGYIVGLGAVSVIETLGFLGRKSPYFTESTIRAHKVTKPLIWLGLVIGLIGAVWIYGSNAVSLFGENAYWPLQLHAVILVLMILNGSWLSFWLSPRLLAREREGRITELLPARWQLWTTLSFFVSIVTWWGSLVLWCLQIV